MRDNCHSANCGAHSSLQSTATGNKQGIADTGDWDQREALTATTHMMAATGQALTATCCSRRCGCGADVGTAESTTPSAKAGDIASTENPVEATILFSSLRPQSRADATRGFYSNALVC